MCGLQSLLDLVPHASFQCVVGLRGLSRLEALLQDTLSPRSDGLLAVASALAGAGGEEGDGLEACAVSLGEGVPPTFLQLRAAEQALFNCGRSRPQGFLLALTGLQRLHSLLQVPPSPGVVRTIATLLPPLLPALQLTIAAAVSEADGGASQASAAGGMCRAARDGGTRLSAALTLLLSLHEALTLLQAVSAEASCSGFGVGGGKHEQEAGNEGVFLGLLQRCALSEAELAARLASSVFQRLVEAVTDRLRLSVLPAVYELDWARVRNLSMPRTVERASAAVLVWNLQLRKSVHVYLTLLSPSNHAHVLSAVLAQSLLLLLQHYGDIEPSRYHQVPFFIIAA